MFFQITIKNGPQTLIAFTGIKDVDKTELTRADMEKLLETEQLLEKVTGYRFHINER